MKIKLSLPSVMASIFVIPTAYVMITMFLFIDTKIEVKIEYMGKSNNHSELFRAYSACRSELFSVSNHSHCLVEVNEYADLMKIKGRNEIVKEISAYRTQVNKQRPIWMKVFGFTV